MTDESAADRSWDYEGFEGMTPDRLCDAASALFYAIAKHHANRTGEPIPLPVHLCPKTLNPPCICSFLPHELDQAEGFLLRMGVIRRRHDHVVPLIDL